MNLTYKRAEIEDIDMLTETRIEVLRAANKLSDDIMYTRPGYRRKGIAYKTLDMLINAAKCKGITSISLEATAMGRPLYEKYGFVKMNDEMELPE